MLALENDKNTDKNMISNMFPNELYPKPEDEIKENYRDKSDNISLNITNEDDHVQNKIEIVSEECNQIEEENSKD
jgi:hypothetical protein